MARVDPTAHAFRAVLRCDLGAFAHKAFNALNPGVKLAWNWHLDAIAYHLSEVEAGRITRLVITLPPRSLKSHMTSVAFPAWTLGRDPSRKIICASYSDTLAATFSRQSREVMASDWYRRTFQRTKLRRSSETELETTQGGLRLATSTGGTLTGRGGDILILDDPMKAEDALSKPARDRVREWYANTLVSRLNDPSTGAIVLVMQRLHLDDLAGHLLAQGGWTHLDLPAIAPEDRLVALGHNRTFQWRAGARLHPERLSATVLDERRTAMGEWNFSAQYLQAPIPADGNLFKRAWFKTDDPPPDADGYGYVLQSWDLAFSGGANADYCVCVTAFVRGARIWILDVMRERLEFGEQLRRYEEHALRWKPREILIERAANASAMLDQVRALEKPGVPSPLLITPRGDKQARAIAATPAVERGDVLLPESASWKDAFIDELCAFPGGSHDDQVDAFAQLVKRAFDQQAYADAPGLIFAEVIY